MKERKQIWTANIIVKEKVGRSLRYVEKFTIIPCNNICDAFMLKQEAVGISLIEPINRTIAEYPIYRHNCENDPRIYKEILPIFAQKRTRRERMRGEVDVQSGVLLVLFDENEIFIKTLDPEAYINQHFRSGSPIEEQ